MLAGTLWGCGMPKGSSDGSGNASGSQKTDLASSENGRAGDDGESGSLEEPVEGGGQTELAEEEAAEEVATEAAGDMADMTLGTDGVGVNASGLASEEPVEYQTGENFQTEEYDAETENRFLQSSVNPLSTFSADVDTASYSKNTRFDLGDLEKSISWVQIPIRISPCSGSQGHFIPSMAIPNRSCSEGWG